MRDGPRQPLEQQLQQHALALRGLARDLVGEQDADDLLQEATLEALQRPPRRPGPIGGWLAGVLRHLAARHRRTEQRRRAREARVARPAAEFPDAPVDERRTVQRLTRELLALPQPYRGVLFLRYLKGLTPTAIAAQTGRPVATVKSRLARGLALLRERLADEDRDWRSALGAAFGLRPAQVAAAAGAGLFAIYAAGSMALVAAWLLFALDGEPAAMPELAKTAYESRPATGVLAETHDEMRSPERVSIDTADLGPLEPTTIRGRCVDEFGRPLPGLPVELRGRVEGNERRYGQWLAEQNREWHDVETFSDDAGQFEFALPLAPIQYELGFERDGLGYTRKIAAADERAVDLGDVRLPAACNVRGRVVDVEGRPALHTAVAVGQVTWETRPLWQNPEYLLAPTVDASFAKRVPSDRDYEIGVNGYPPERGGRMSIPPGTTEIAWEVVVEVPPGEETIRGTVVDTRGLPVEGVQVSALDLTHSSVTRTDAQGRFELWHQDKLTTPLLGVNAIKPGWRRAHDPKVSWGDRDLRLVLEKRTDGPLRVRALTEDGQPVTYYGMHIEPRVDVPELERVQFREHGVSDFGVRNRRPESVLVVPSRWDLWLSEPIAIEPGMLEIDVIVPAASNRLLRVEYHDGSPAAGIEVESLDRGNQELTTHSRAFEAGHGTPGKHILRLGRDVTDARGEVGLRGPRGGSIALRLPGPGHPPMVIQTVDLRDPEPLVVRLPAAARLAGTLGPQQPELTPGLRLRRVQDGHVEILPERHEQRVTVAPDGSFEFDGVPPGTWELKASWDEDEQGLASEEQTIATVELHPGETTHVELRVSAQHVATLAARVLLNGKPLRRQTVNLTIASGRYAAIARTTDLDGRFTVRLREARVCVTLPVTRRTTGFLYWSMVPSRETVFLPGGLITQQTFHIDTGKTHVRLLANGGRPAPDVWLLLRDSRGHGQLTSGSDENGSLLVEAGAGTYRMQVLRRSHQRRVLDVQGWACGLRGDDPAAGAWIDLGELTIRPRETAEREVRLPASFDR